MKAFESRPFLFAALGVFLLSTGVVFADQTVETGIPGGDGKELLDNPKDPSSGQGSIIVRDEECAKKTKGKAYEKCVHDKLEKAKKKSDH